MKRTVCVLLLAAPLLGIGNVAWAHGGIHFGIGFGHHHHHHFPYHHYHGWYDPFWWDPWPHYRHYPWYPTYSPYYEMERTIMQEQRIKRRLADLKGREVEISREIQSLEQNRDTDRSKSTERKLKRLQKKKDKVTNRIAKYEAELKVLQEKK